MQRYNQNLRKSLLLAEYFSFWTNQGSEGVNTIQGRHQLSNYQTIILNFDTSWVVVIVLLYKLYIL